LTAEAEKMLEALARALNSPSTGSRSKATPTRRATRRST
jgi:hypothetical protein